jgi:hypothetical protein
MGQGVLVRAHEVSEGVPDHATVEDPLRVVARNTAQFGPDQVTKERRFSDGRWAQSDLNRRPPGYQPGAPAKLSYGPRRQEIFRHLSLSGSLTRIRDPAIVRERPGTRKQGPLRGVKISWDRLRESRLSRNPRQWLNSVRTESAQTSCGARVALHSPIRD